MGHFGDYSFANICLRVVEEKSNRVVRKVKILDKELVVDFERTDDSYKISIFEYGNDKPYLIERRFCSDNRTAKEIIIDEVKKYVGYDEIEEVERWDGVIY